MTDLRQFVRARGVRQADIAAALNISEGTISKWLTRRHAVPSWALRPLSDLLGVTVEELLPQHTAASESREAA